MFRLPKLPYDYDALEPHIDARTMEIHHTKHHNGYTTKLNGAIDGTDLEGKSIEEILADAGHHSTAVRNNGGGFHNHRLFWEVMGPNGGGKPVDRLSGGRPAADRSRCFALERHAAGAGGAQDALHAHQLGAQGALAGFAQPVVAPA